RGARAGGVWRRRGGGGAGGGWGRGGVGGGGVWAGGGGGGGGGVGGGGVWGGGGSGGGCAGVGGGRVGGGGGGGGGRECGGARGRDTRCRAKVGVGPRSAGGTQRSFWLLQTYIVSFHCHLITNIGAFCCSRCQKCGIGPRLAPRSTFGTEIRSGVPDLGLRV